MTLFYFRLKYLTEFLAISILAIILSHWLLVIIMGDLWHSFADKWYLSVEMGVGSLITDFSKMFFVRL